MKRILGSLICLFTVFLLGFGFLFNSFSAISHYKWANNNWNNQLTKFHPKENIFKALVDSDDLSDSFELDLDKKVYNPIGLSDYFRHISVWPKNKKHFYFLDLLARKHNTIPLWLKVRSIII